MILKRTFIDTPPSGEPEGADTYYIYDDFGNLTYVIPPKVTTNDGVSTTELAELCYQYKYDYRNRLIEKKIPGKGDANTWESIVYNKLDQPILTQDPNQKAKGEWLYTKYDAFGRVAYTGKLTDAKERSELQTEAHAYNGDLWVARGSAVSIGGTTMYYNDGGYPKVQHGEALTINYYNDYEFDRVGINDPGTVYGVGTSDRTKSLPTGSKVKVLDTDDWITTVTYYDSKARPIYVASKNEYLNTTDIVETKLDFVGKVQQTKTTHTKGGNAAIVTIDTFTYDHMGRITKQTQTINGQQEVLAENSYDELGQLISKKMGGGLQDINYRYNVRGWLKGINDMSNLGEDLFAYNLNYNDIAHGATPQYKYNIAEIDWKTANDNTHRWYKYEYNAFEQPLSVTNNDSKYSVSNITYDTMGNILSLTRNGWQNTTNYDNLDILSYDYAPNSNKLLSVTDGGNKTHGFKDRNSSGNDYDYDSNGNLIQDKNKGITNVSYNHFNFPTKVDVTNPDHNGNIQYTYDANGVKLKKTATDSGNVTTTEYNGNFVYENGSLKSITHAEGYTEKESDGSYKYVYQLKDIWGNTRITFADDNDNGSVNKSEIRREQNYYPFGMPHQGYNSASYGAKNNLKTFQGQELTEDLGVNTHEWRYRMSDRSIGRFWQIDPLAETYDYNATYAFAENKLGLGVELEGLEVAPFSPIDIFNFESGGKPVLTLGLHNIVLPTAPVTEEDGAGAFIVNVAKSMWNGIAGTWNAGMQGKNMGEITDEGMRQMDKTAKRIENGEATQRDAENIVAGLAMSFIRSKTGKNTSSASTPKTSRAARREAMRKQGIPTSQQPTSQSKNASGREYTYTVPQDGGGTKTKSVQQQTMDRSHQGQPHWEAGSVKIDNGKVQYNNYNRAKLKSDKSKVDYEQ